MYTGQNSTGSQQDQCWQSTQAIIENCYKNGFDEGWANGPNPNQFYQGGFRSVNAQDTLASSTFMNSGHPMPTATHTQEPSKPSQLSCFSGKPKPFRQFDESKSQDVITKYCESMAQHLNDINFNIGTNFYNLDDSNNPGTQSDNMLEVGGVISTCDGVNPRNNFLFSCESSLTYIVQSCESTSDTDAIPFWILLTHKNNR
jgi:hypothetical protein